MLQTLEPKSFSPSATSGAPALPSYGIIICPTDSSLNQGNATCLNAETKNRPSKNTRKTQNKYKRPPNRPEQPFSTHILRYGKPYLPKNITKHTFCVVVVNIYRCRLMIFAPSCGALGYRLLLSPWQFLTFPSCPLPEGVVVHAYAVCSILSSKLKRTLVFVTPPKPKAGMILHMRAAVLWK